MQIRLISAVMGSTIMPSCLDLLCSVFYAKMASPYHTLRQLMTEPLIVWQSRSVLLVTCLPLPWWMPCLSVFGGPVTHLPWGVEGKTRSHLLLSYPIPHISNIRHFFTKTSAVFCKIGSRFGRNGKFLSLHLFPCPPLPLRLIRW